MYSIKKKLSIILVVCTVVAILLSALLVNLTINKTFNEYMSDIQAKRNERITIYFEEVYKKYNKWTANSGNEIMHEAYMSNYCLTLRDGNKNIVWGMDPNQINFPNHYGMMDKKDKGVYTTQTYEIKSGNAVVGYIDIGQYSSVLMSQEDANFKFAVNRSITISVIITILITVMVSLLLSKQFSIPIIEVSDTSVQLSNGNYNARSKTKSNIVELNNLVDSVNILGEKLKRQDSIRKKLVSDISHEIRTPLNILQNNLEAMVDGIFPVTNERLVSLNEEVIRFGKLLDNLNILKEFESEEVTLNNAVINIDKLIKSVIKDFVLLLEEKTIEVLYNSSEDKDYGIIGDIDKLKQVFINIISNAIKFSKIGGRIWVDLCEDRTHIIVKIKDNGIGIEKKDLPLIFERLYRGDKSRNEIEGTGIGLTIVKKILMLHSAAIDVESEVGRGSTFTIYFNKLL